MTSLGHRPAALVSTNSSASWGSLGFQIGVTTVPSRWAGDTGGLLPANWVNAALFAIVAALWIGALVTPDLATCAYGKPQWALGYVTLITGWAGPLMMFWHPSVGMFAWYANV